MILVVILIILLILVVLPMLFLGSIFGSVAVAAKNGLECANERSNAGCEIKTTNALYDTKKICKNDCHVFQKCKEGYTNIKNFFGSNLCVKEGQMCETTDPYAKPFVYDSNLVCGYDLTSPCRDGYTLQGETFKSCQKEVKQE